MTLVFSRGLVMPLLVVMPIHPIPICPPHKKDAMFADQVTAKGREKQKWGVFH